MQEVVSRPWQPDDLPACLAIFDGNVPRFFAAAERPEFHGFLNGQGLSADPYLVLEGQGRVMACGGLSIDRSAGQASLCWGMVARDLQRSGLGTRLMQARLALARATPGIERLVLSTSQHTQGFYAGFGFAMAGVTPNGFGPGLDCWDMVLPLS